MRVEIKYFDAEWGEVADPKDAAYAVQLTFDDDGRLIKSVQMVRG